MNELWVAALTNLISAVIGGTFTFLLGRRKARADAEGAIALAAKQIVEAAAAQAMATENRMLTRMKEHDQIVYDLRSELHILRARVRELELNMTATLAGVMAVATSASEQVAKLTVLHDSERELLTREIARLHALAGMQAYSEPAPVRTYGRARDRFTNGNGG